MESGFTEFDFTLRDGRTVHVRAMRPTDEAEFLQAFARLSDDARYMRFMRFVQRAQPRPRCEACSPPFPRAGSGSWRPFRRPTEIDIVGSATFFIGNDPTSCEFAITVASDFGGVGLASTLLTALIGAAKARGLTEMDGFVLAANQPMLRLARRLGFSVAPDPEDGTVRICRLRLADA